MTLLELLEAVKDENLSRQSLEKYRDDLIHVHTKAQLELAEIEKREAKYLAQKPPEVKSVVYQIQWDASDDGQRQIELNRILKAVAKEVDSLKSRVYALI